MYIVVMGFTFSAFSLFPFFALRTNVLFAIRPDLLLFFSPEIFYIELYDVGYNMSYFFKMSNISAMSAGNIQYDGTGNMSSTYDQDTTSDEHIDPYCELCVEEKKRRIAADCMLDC